MHVKSPQNYLKHKAAVQQPPGLKSSNNMYNNIQHRMASDSFNIETQNNNPAFNSSIAFDSNVLNNNFNSIASP